MKLERRGRRAFGLAVLLVALATIINRLIYGKTHEDVLIMVYLLGLMPVFLQGVRRASVLAVVLTVAAFDFFFTQPRYTLVVNDAGYYFTFSVMAIVGLTISSLTTRLAAALGTSEQHRRALERANAQLKSLDRLKTQLISNVSHELRTPLATIVGNAELLQDQLAGPLSEPQQQSVSEILKGTGRLTQMVNYMLDFAQLDAGTFSFEMQTSDLRGLASEVIEMVRPRAEEAHVVLEARLPDEAVPVEMDALRIAQVMSYLLDNAIKFTPRGGRIVVTLTHEAQSATIQVCDTGIGIAEEELPYVFQRFYQGDATSTRAYGGTGLGLALSKALVEAHGGHIGVLSAPGQGSTFWFELPSRQAQPASLRRGASGGQWSEERPERQSAGE